MKTESKYNIRTTTVAMNGECYNTWCGKDGYITETTRATLNRTESTWHAVYRRPLHFVRRTPYTLKPSPYSTSEFTQSAYSAHVSTPRRGVRDNTLQPPTLQRWLRLGRIQYRSHVGPRPSLQWLRATAVGFQPTDGRYLARLHVCSCQ